jgi:hypothetical protein
MKIKWMVRHVTTEAVEGTVTVFYGPYDLEQDAADLVEFIELNNFNANAYLEMILSPIYVND